MSLFWLNFPEEIPEGYPGDVETEEVRFRVENSEGEVDYLELHLKILTSPKKKKKVALKRKASTELEEDQQKKTKKGKKGEMEEKEKMVSLEEIQKSLESEYSDVLS
jgi:hypothetical protein